VGQPLAYQCTKAAKTLFIDVYDHLPPRLPKVQDETQCRFVDNHCQDGARRA